MLNNLSNIAGLIRGRKNGSYATVEYGTIMREYSNVKQKISRRSREKLLVENLTSFPYIDVTHQEHSS